MDDDIRYCDCAPPDEVLKLFKVRRDGQIMGLELLLIALGAFITPLPIFVCLFVWSRRLCTGICSFEHHIRGERLVIYSDNTGAESACNKGASYRLSNPPLLCHARLFRF